MRDRGWDGLSIQQALLKCEIVVEDCATDLSQLCFLKLGSKIIPLGTDRHFADMLQFALQRNAKAFDASAHSEMEEAE